MNFHLDRLHRSAARPDRTIIGLMSGTSVDGLDIALCRIAGTGMTTRIELLQFETAVYGSEYKEEIASVFSKKNVDLEKLTLLNGWVALQHAAMINDALKKWRVDRHDIDAIASHGQTIYHAPRALHQLSKFGNATLQIGDGDHLAVATGCICLSDFRQKHIASGGEGAPLAVYGDFLVFSSAEEDRIMLNIGGIANFTFLPASRDANLVFSTDTGPGNTMMDGYVRELYSGRYFDEDAALARSGSVDERLLAALSDHPFFEQGFPKTTGPELFNYDYLQRAINRSATAELAPPDIMATLNRFSADTIVGAIRRTTAAGRKFAVYVSGGGMHNPLLMENIRTQLPGYSFHSTTKLSINPDAKEAVLFALLANETIAGTGELFGTGRNGIPNVSMGKISFPS